MIKDLVWCAICGALGYLGLWLMLGGSFRWAGLGGGALLGVGAFIVIGSAIVHGRARLP